MIGRSPGPAQTLDPSLVEAAVVVCEVGSDSTAGLTSAEAAARLAKEGPNRLVAEAFMPAWRKLLAEFADPLIYLLLVAIAVSFLAWVIEGAEGLPIEAIVIAAIVLANGVLGFLQKCSAERAVAALLRMAAPAAHVLRDGAETAIPADEVVPGDILILGEGDAITPDGRLLVSASLTISESSLTGESTPVLKDTSPQTTPR